MTEKKFSGHEYDLSEEDRDSFLGDDFLHISPNDHAFTDDPSAQAMKANERLGCFQYDLYDWDSFEPIDYNVIPLTQGYFAVVSVEDYKKVSKHKWFAHVKIDQHNGQIVKVYAGRRRTVSEKKRGAPKLVYLHRFLKCVISAGHKKVVDHLNGDPLDCRRCNLVITDQTGNMGNTSFAIRTVNRKTKRGVKLIKRRRKNGEVRVTSYKGRIKVRGKEIYSKTVFSCPERAHRWYLRVHRVLYPVASSWRDKDDVPEIVFPKTKDQVLLESIPF